MNKRLFIFGAGAHARKVYHCSVSSGWRVEAFVDEAADAVTPISTLPILNVIDLTEPKNGDSIFIAIGRAEVRMRLMDQMSQAGWNLPTIVHPSAWVAPDVKFGAGVLIAAGAVVETAAVVGRGAIIDIGVLLDHECQVGAFCHLRAGEVHGPRSFIPSPI